MSDYDLELRGLSATYGTGIVLRDVDLAVERGAIVALLGANGAGKTTTFRAIVGAVATTGTVVIAGRPVVRREPESVARLGVAHVPQGRGTLGALTVRENLELGAYVQRDRKRRLAAYDRVLTYFPKLARRATQAAGTLSGGEQQMLAIGRALMMEPRVLLLDEPSLGLAPLVVAEIFDLIRTINRNDGTTVLLAEQNAALALQSASHAYVIDGGRIAASGPAERLRDDEAVRISYLGY